MLKLPEDSTVELLKASVGKKTGISIAKVSMTYTVQCMHTQSSVLYADMALLYYHSRLELPHT